MTGLCTQNYRPSPHVVAAGALVRLASPFFHKGHFGADDPNRPINYGVWLTLRKMAENLLERRGLDLSEYEVDLLGQALRFCPKCDDVDFLNSLTFAKRN